MNTQRFVISTIAVAAFMFAYEWIVHSQFLTPLYNETPQLWRPDSEMNTLLPWIVAIKLAMAAIITYLFTRHYEARGYPEGARFGLYIGLLLGVMQFGAYTYLPVSLHLGFTWLAVYVIEGIGAGLVAAATYRA